MVVVFFHVEPSVPIVVFTEALFHLFHVLFLLVCLLGVQLFGDVLSWIRSLMSRGMSLYLLMFGLVNLLVVICVVTQMVWFKINIVTTISRLLRRILTINVILGSILWNLQIEIPSFFKVYGWGEKDCICH